MSMINQNINDVIHAKEQCYGCRSCEQVCPKKAIHFSADTEGFLYPYINEELCVNCGLCIKHCPFMQKTIPQNTTLFFGLRLRDTAELLESTSGGVFSAFADYVIENGGAVFGCAFDDKLQARHICVETKNDLQLLKKSKYVTSNTLHTYSEVADILNSQIDRPVLYTGTPCQIHGLYSFLGKRPENLYTIDIICHGVPSQKLFDKYIEWLSIKNHGSISYYGFRDKDVAGWRCGGKVRIKTKSKTKIINGAIDPYYASFLRGETFRLSCYQCDYANIKFRPADITMGDFWGIEFFHPEFYSKNGNSCCVINTEKGKDFFLDVKERFDYIETTAENICGMNSSLLHSSQKPIVRGTIYNGIDDLPVEKYIKKLNAPIYKRFMRYFISFIPHNIKVYIKKVLKRLSR